MMKPGAAESAPLLQRQETHETPSKGEIYLKPGITRMQQNLAYWQTYWQSMGWLFLVICCLTLINCFVITTTRLDKKV